MKQPSWFQLAAAALLVLPYAAASAHATTFIPMSIENLARSSVATVLGTVQDLHSVEARDGQLYTLVTIAVEQVLRGKDTGPVIVLKEDGGRVASRQEVQFGAPSFEPGQHILLFLTVRPDGSLRTTQLALGKFDLALDRSGMPQAQQHFGAGARVLSRPGVDPSPSVPLGAILRDIEGAGRALAAPTRVLSAPPEATDPGLHSEVSAPLTFLSGRFFEPDESVSLPFVIDQRGDSILGLAASRQAIDDAFAAWSTVPTATIHLDDTGLTSDVTAPCPGPNVIIFDDPMNAIGSPQNCTGTLAVGGFCQSSFEAKQFGGRSFERALRGKVTFANGWDGCDFWTACNIAEIATHEIGHAIGLGHSSENFNEADPLLRDATMYYRAHFDGRCASIRTYDDDALGSLYPTTIPPTILTPDPLPLAKAGAPYDQMLTATGGAGGFAWSLGRGGFAGLTLSPSGELAGVPEYGGASFFQITATDSNGDSHTKLLHLGVTGATATPTRTPTRTATPTATATATLTPTVTDTATPSATPSNTATPSLTPTDTPTATPTASATSAPTETPIDTAVPTDTPTPNFSLTPTATAPASCIGDCDGSGEVSIDELLTLVNIALGNVEAIVCPAGDRNHDGMVTIDELLAAVTAALAGCA